MYDGKNLKETFSFEGKISDTLAREFDVLQNKYDIKNIYFARGPGSFMSIKLTYTFLKTISIVKGIKLFASDSFYFNQNRPIKAMGKLYFVKNDENIVTQKLENVDACKVDFADVLDIASFSENIEPLYILPAVSI